ncbi:FMR1-interacting protein NUFIP2 isoform X1 [Natator depressus]|uniref:FMR1-interacting protein NUFIP2 isoform X1 n=2 Tax=Natator depressus TaxID=27790 RepID=UPI003EBCDC24
MFRGLIIAFFFSIRSLTFHFLILVFLFLPVLGYGELNGNAGEREVSLKGLCADETTNPSSRVPNGSQQLVDTNVNPKQTVKVSTFGKAGIKPKNFIQKNSMDKKNEKIYENKLRENQSSDKPEAVSIPNGVVTNSSGYITNGYVGKGADNDGSGSESGYTTPKKRKGRRNSAKGCENLNLVQDKIMQQEVNTPSLKQELESFKTDYSEQKGNRVDNTKPVWKYEAGAGGAGRGKTGVGEVQRKNSDAKPGISSKKFDDRPKGKHASAAASKEDSWTLFKPPPVFPVDNSSAKIVPKISYASKVKENLNKAAQNPSSSLSSSSSSSSTGETQAQMPSRLSQVPMSAMKSVTSASFSNGPILAGTDGNVYSPGSQPLLTMAASTVPSASPESVHQDISAASPAAEQKKSSLFIYPSNMQSVLLGTAQVDLPSQTNQQNLGDIFQNQWGLSFINEPSAGPETVLGKSTDNKIMEVTFQGEYPATLVSQGAEIIPSGTEQPVFPKAYELEKRTSPQILSGIIKPGTASEIGVLSLEPHHIGDLQMADTSSQGALVFLSKDYELENPLASPTNNLLASAKDQRYQRGLERKDSWGSFDLRAAIVYHTKEMESIWNLQKQDPKRIITYDEAMECPDQ